MESERQQLLRTIADNPGDNFPRLVLAEWMEEEGREPGDADHAELARIQIRIAALNREALSDKDCENDGCEICRERRKLQTREKELLPQIEAALEVV